DANGAPTDIELPVSYGAGADQAIREAAERLRFEPARRAGEPIPARIRLQLAPPRAEPEPVPPAAADEDAGVAEEPPPTSAPAPPAPPPPTGEYGARAEVERPQPGAASRVKLTGNELTMIPGTFGEPLRVVATLPGVVRSPFGLGFFLVRG